MHIYVFNLFSLRYAIRDGNKIKIFKNFKERKSFKPEYGAESEYQRRQQGQVVSALDLKSGGCGFKSRADH